jgi:A118 family predicted phage portal protein
MDFTIEDETAQEYAKEIFNNNDFAKNFERYLESGLALGGLAMKPYHDDGQIKIAYAQAPSFFPLRSNTNDINEAAIATHMQKKDGSRVLYYTLLEFHEWDGDKYVITNELYRSEISDRVGIQVPLTDYFENLEKESILKDFSRPLFTYMKPFGFNNKNITSPLGLSVYDNATTTLRQINTTYDQYRWEIKMGQRRVLIPDGLTTVASEGEKPKQYFDTNQNVFLKYGGGIDDNKILDVTTPIRSDSYIRSLNHFMRTLEVEIGLSTGTFTFDAMGMKTATEVVSENSMTYQTRNSHLTSVERSIKELIISCLELAKSYGLYSGNIPTLEDIQIDFDDGVFLDRKSELDFLSKAMVSGLVSRRHAMKKLWNVSEEEIDEMLTELKEEQAASLDTKIRGSDRAIFEGGV